MDNDSHLHVPIAMSSRIEEYISAAGLGTELDNANNPVYELSLLGIGTLPEDITMFVKTLH